MTGRCFGALKVVGSAAIEGVPHRLGWYPWCCCTSWSGISYGRCTSVLVSVAAYTGASILMWAVDTSWPVPVWVVSVSTLVAGILVAVGEPDRGGDG